MDTQNTWRIKSTSVDYLVADLPQLLFSMYVSQLLLANPLFGAALYLLYAPLVLWAAYYRSNLNETPLDRRIWRYIPVLLTAGTLMALLLIIIYPMLVHSNRSNLVALFVLLALTRGTLTSAIAQRSFRRRWVRLAVLASVQLVMLALCYYLCLRIVPEGSRLTVCIFFLVAALVAMSSSREPLTPNEYAASAANVIRNCHSYMIFSRMTFFYYIAVYLGIVMYILFMSFMPDRLQLQIYLLIAVWLLLAYITLAQFYKFITRHDLHLHLWLYFLGAAAWVVAFLLLFRTRNITFVLILTLVWSFGAVAMYAVVRRLRDDFKIVSRLMGNEVDEDSLHRDAHVLQVLAAGVAGIVMLCLLTALNFFSLRAGAVLRFPLLMTIVPLVFLAVSLGYALLQPINDRNRHRLTYYENYQQPASVEGTAFVDRLQAIFIRKYRMRFGVRIIMSVLRPFLRLSVYGTENIDPADFPCVFICNHRTYYGPVAAVMYLPVYFRPWIDRRMVDDELIAEYMYTRGMSHRRWPSEKAKRRLAAAASYPVRWIVHSFEPVRVDRLTPRGALDTINNTVDALLAGDNVLLFPEKQGKSDKGVYEGQYELQSIGEFQTGFVHVGKQYFDQTGRAIRFYPLYFAREQRSFNIGKPLTYNTEAPARDEKQRMAQELRKAMLALKEEAETRPSPREQRRQKRADKKQNKK